VVLSYYPGLTAPTAPGSYTVTATIIDPNYTGSTSSTLVIGKATATVALGDLSATYTGSPIEATATTAPGGLNVTLTYAPGLTAPTAPGSYTVTATIDDPNYTGSTTSILVIGKATATVALGDLSPTYTGSPIEATATTAPGGLNVTMTYDGSPTAPTEPGSYLVVATIDDPNYTGSTSGILVILPDAGSIPLTITRTGPNSANLGWPSAAGLIYQIETSTNLLPVWNPLGAPITGAGSPMVFGVTLGEPRRFFRLIVTAAP